MLHGQINKLCIHLNSRQGEGVEWCLADDTVFVHVSKSLCLLLGWLKTFDDNSLRSSYLNMNVCVCVTIPLHNGLAAILIRICLIF